MYILKNIYMDKINLYTHTRTHTHTHTHLQYYEILIMYMEVYKSIE